MAVLVTVALVGAAGASGAGAQEDFPPVDQPGVTDTEIRVGGVVTESNDPTGGTYESAFDGVEAYFDYINSKGGVYGRELVLDSKRDDAVGNNRSEVQALISQDNVFAVLPVAVLLFAGADLLAEAGIPTFGWNINEEWGSENNTPGPPNLFGEKGSFLCFTCGEPGPPQWLAKKLGLKRLAVLAYNVPQSEACAVGLENGFENFPTAELVFLDKSLQFGNPDFSAQVSRMIEENVDVVSTCMDANGVLNLSREMQKQGLDAVQYLPNAYNHEFIEENARFFQDDYVLTFFTPFEVRPKPRGLKLYEKWIKRSGGKKNENSLSGWINADLFVTGLEAAGPDFTRQKVVDAVNAITDYDAKGLLAGIDWTTGHEEDVDCMVVSKIVDGKFKPAFGKPNKPFICFADDLQKIPANPQVEG